MLTDEEVLKVKAKMKDTHTFGARLAKEWGVTRQSINLVIKQKCQSKNLEMKFREWLNE